MNLCFQQRLEEHSLFYTASEFPFDEQVEVHLAGVIPLSKKEYAVSARAKPSVTQPWYVKPEGAFVVGTAGAVSYVNISLLAMVRRNVRMTYGTSWSSPSMGHWRVRSAVSKRTDVSVHDHMTFVELV